MRRMVFKFRFLSLVFFALLAGVWPMAAQAANAPGAPSLGAAARFAVLAGTTVTNTLVGSTKITGDLGVSPGSAVTNFPPGTVTGGSIHHNDGLAQQAHANLITAYNEAATVTSPSTDLSGQDLGGKTLTPGVYTFSSSAHLGGTLILNGSGTYIFQIVSTLVTAAGPPPPAVAGASVVLMGNADPCSVFWQVGSSATIGTYTSFAGTIMALTSITVSTGATLTGRALAINGAVTLDANTITNKCGNGNPGGCTTGGGKDTDENADKSDENADKSNDAADRSDSAKSATDGASDSHGDSKDENGKNSEHDGNDGCHSGDKNDNHHDNNNDNKDNKKKSND